LAGGPFAVIAGHQQPDRDDVENSEALVAVYQDSAMRGLPLFSRVRIATNDYADRGAPAGTVGFIIDVHGDEAYEIEVSDTSGTTLALFAARAEHVALVE
jgi:hypothetical protein